MNASIGILATNAIETAVEETRDQFREIDWNAIWTKIVEFSVSLGGKLLLCVLWIILSRLVIRFTMKLLVKSPVLKKADPGVSRFLTQLVRIALNVIVIVTVIGILGVPMTSIVAVIAAASAAVGLALQGALSNFAGGIMILIFHPFHLDDFIDAGGYSGTVLDIGIFYTVLRTPDNKKVTIPNGSVMSQPLTNYSAYDSRRLELTFTVAYGTDVDLVRKILLETAATHDLVLSDPAPFARLSAHEDSALKFTVRVWVKKADYWTVNFDLLERVHKRFEQEGITIPFNQLDVHVVGDEQDHGKQDTRI